MHKITEAEFRKQVVQFARLHRWTVAGIRPVRIVRRNGSTYHETPMEFDGSGFPDLLLVRDRIIFAELKIKGGRLSEDQKRWQSAIKIAEGQHHVWFPSDWAEIEKVLS